MFRKKTACLWWMNTRSTSALKPNSGFWRSSSASRIPPSPSKFSSSRSQSDQAFLMPNQCYYLDSGPSISTAVLHRSATEETKPRSSKNIKFFSLFKFDIQTFVCFFVSSLSELSHIEIPPRGCAGIRGHQASNSSSDHTNGQHISSTHVILLLSPINEGALCSLRVWFGFCVCILVQTYTLLYVIINISVFFLKKTDQHSEFSYKISPFRFLLTNQRTLVSRWCFFITWITWSDWQKQLQLDCHKHFLIYM